ncbi:MAG: hypothetical protein C4297_05655 [Gemmataceae bacterium]
MSTASATARRLPVEVSNLLVSWWLALGLGTLGVCFLWPKVALFGTAGQGMAWLVPGIIAVVNLFIGGWVHTGLAARRERIRWLYRLFLGGALPGLLPAAVLVLILVTVPNGTSTLGISGAKVPVLSVSLLTLIIFLPVFFGILSLSLSLTDEVLDFLGLLCPRCGGRKVEVLEGGYRRRCKNTNCGFEWTESLDSETQSVSAEASQPAPEAQGGPEPTAASAEPAAQATAMPPENLEATALAQGPGSPSQNVEILGPDEEQSRPPAS